MELNRSHLHLRITSSATCSSATTTTTTTTHLFRSSMKLTKSILSPIKATRHGGAVSFSFLSRHLRARGKASSFFAPTGKKRSGGAAGENPDPSSPKVTCIGQVRVKSKQKYGSLSKKRIKGDANSFRKTEQSRAADHGNEDSNKVCGRLPPPPPPQRYANGGSGHYQPPQERSQRWVHLPVSFCEALRAFGAEFSCLFPCRKSCFSRQKTEERGRSFADENVVARWLAAEHGGGEVSIGGSRRQEVFEDIEVRDDDRVVEVKGQSVKEEEDEEEASRVSISSLPPENALLLMRCRSDPMKMAALAPRFSWDARAAVPEQETEKVKEEEEEDAEQSLLLVDKDEIFEQIQEEQRILNGEDDNSEQLREEEREKEIDENEDDVFLERENEESESNMSSFEALLDQEKTEHYDDVSSAESHKREEEEQETEHSIINTPDKVNDDVTESETGNHEMVLIGDIQEERVLPECLLLMMCEPKLSMEVSKETWVCSTDFVRRLPERPSKPAKVAAAAVKRTESRQPKRSVPLPPPTKKSDVQPARSSCCLPAAAASMAAVIEQKLGAYEPFALTRCKSAPIRTAAAAKLVAPETCFNASMKMEPQISVGAAGVGF